MSSLKTIKIDFGNNHCGYVFYTRNLGIGQFDIIDEVIKQSLQNSFTNGASITFEADQNYVTNMDLIGDMHYGQILQIEPDIDNLTIDCMEVIFLRETFNVYFFDHDNALFTDQERFYYIDTSFRGSVSVWNNVKFYEWRNRFDDVNFL